MKSMVSTASKIIFLNSNKYNLHILRNELDSSQFIIKMKPVRLKTESTDTSKECRPRLNVISFRNEYALTTPDFLM
jgi:hypothetical protein